jgi:hypothetical protein
VLAHKQQVIVRLVLVFVTWLHISRGISQEAAVIALKVLAIILDLTWKLAIRATFETFDDHAYLGLPIPKDIRTAVHRLSIDPVIMHKVACPKCFAPYVLNPLPERCTWCKTARSKACGEPLWTTHQTRKGPINVPRRLYSTQSFEAWLEFFLSQPGIEDLISKSYQEHPMSATMHGIYDSPAWRSLGEFTTTHGNLTFAIFVDWFNPFMNKIAGKQASIGVVMLVCLNLPSELRLKVENTFFLGLFPGPREPDVVTVSHVSDPVISQLVNLWTGKVIRSYKFPNGHLR